MRTYITAIALLVALLHIGASGYAQKITLHVKDMPVADVLNQIKQQSGYVFFYDQGDVKDKKITVDVRDVSVKEALDACFQNKGLTYTMEGKTVVVKKENSAKKEAGSTGGSLSGGTAIDPAVVFHGTVVDSNGRPLEGASVSLIRKGKMASAVVTDEKGEFRLFAEPGDVLAISHVGFQIYTHKIGKDEDQLAVRLQPRVNQLDNVVVTIDNGYQKILPEQSTGAVSQITTKQYESQINTTFLAGLQGKLPGLLINNDITFNGNNLFQVRGLSTISAGSQPLIVLDGYPTSLALSDINPNEIKSVTLLKDAAAAAIYGVKASNGVLVVERKEATRGAPQYAFRVTSAYTPRVNYSRYKWAPTDTYLNYIRAAYHNGDPSFLINALSWGPTLSLGSQFEPGMDILYQRGSGLITDAQVAQRFNQLGSYNNTSDYKKLFLQTANTQTYNLDISGGNERATYYITGAYTGNKSNQIENSNNQVQFASRTNFNFTNRFSLQLIEEFNETHNTTAPVPAISSVYPFEHFKDDNGNPASIYSGSVTNVYYVPTLLAEGLPDPMYYPLVDVHQVSDKTHGLDNRFTGNFTYKIGYGFNLQFGGVYETSRTDERYYASELSSVARGIIDWYAEKPTLAGAGPTFQVPDGGYLRQVSSSLLNYTVRAQLDYSRHFGSDHTVNAILGSEVDRTLTQSNSSAAFGYDDQTLLQQPVNYADIFENTQGHVYLPERGSAPLTYSNIFNQSYVDNRIVSGYANALYSFRSKYSLTGSIRIDQSNLFGTDPKYRYKPLWSTGAAWNISKEKFMDNVHWVHNLKLRVSEGFDGNVAKNSIPQVIAKSVLNPATEPANTPALALFAPANPGLRWEETNNFNVGLDWSIFKNISGSIDYYFKKSTNLLAPAGNTIDPTRGTGVLGENSLAINGAPQAYINSASINNQGLEINFNADWITRKHFNWYTGFALSGNVNKVLKVYSNVNSQSQSSAWIAASQTGYLTGYATDPLLSYRFAGLDNTGHPQIYDQSGKLIGSPGVTGADGGRSWLVYSGTGIPQYSVGMSNRVDIGPLYAYCMINYYGGFKVRAPRPDPSVARPLAGAQNYWQQAGDEQKTDIMNPTIQAQSNAELYAYQFANRYVVSGSYMTLSAVTLSYDFGRSSPLLKRHGLTHCELLLQGNNLYTRGFNRYNYSQATGDFSKRFLTPTYTIGLYTNF